MRTKITAVSLATLVTIVSLLALVLAQMPARAQQDIPSDQASTRIPVTAVGTGSTGAVTATLAAANGKTTFICGFDVSAAGSATISPITVTGLLGGTFTYQGISAGGAPFMVRFAPCLPASAVDQAIAVVTTADGTATATDVNAFGYQYSNAF